MAAYVHKLGGQGRLLFGRTSPPPPMFGLTADTQDELHAFAARLGIRRNPGTPVGPQQELVTRHYLLTEGERDRAVELGAQVISAREADKMERQRAAMRGESQLRTRTNVIESSCVCRDFVPKCSVRSCCSRSPPGSPRARGRPALRRRHVARFEFLLLSDPGRLLDDPHDLPVGDLVLGPDHHLHRPVPQP